MTNGGHKLGRIRIFTGSRFNNSADVQWVDSLQPNARIGGFMSSGRIQMSDKFDGYKISVGDFGWRGAGYTLAHECGHYVYGVYDEYELRNGDIPVVPSIMNNQWFARRGNYAWLNFSTLNNIGNFANTEQGRRHKADAWSYLTRSSAKFSVLNGRAPSVANTYTYGDTTYSWVKHDLSASRARDSLKIIWMGNAIDIDLVLDRSGSMTGQPFADVKTAAKSFVEAIKVFSNNFELAPSIGITAFSTTVTDVYPITPLTTNINQIKSAIDALTIDDLTAMYDGCSFSLNKLISYSSDSSTRLSMLLTDGADNSSIYNTASSVISKAVANNIPIFTFGYGDNEYY